ncbi:MAG: RrF2 family transcriptional regulator [Oscillospiraceae bacterium]|jgi:Rrf2 family iron-sulfur cluster assembly transcriptional regulator
MIVSTKGRYALRIMLDLSQHYGEGRVSVAEISKRQSISRKYLESIISSLVKAGYVNGTRGKGGGYVLTRPPSEYRVSDIIRLTEGSVAPVSCVDGSHLGCSMASECLTFPMWAGLDRVIETYLGAITIQDLLDGKIIRPEMSDFTYQNNEKDS